ncbi:unnamed protein product [Peronospora effusa]|nr:unnamed protein product [Peronospora effusa]
MSRARCSISYRNTQSLEDKDKTDAQQMEFSMAFMISANTVKRVEDGVLLLQAVVESTEQQLRKYQGRGKREEQIQEKARKRWEKKEKDRFVADDEREEILQEEACHAQTQTQQQRGFETATSRNRSRSCSALGEETMTLQRQRHPKLPNYEQCVRSPKWR